MGEKERPDKGEQLTVRRKHHKSSSRDRASSINRLINMFSSKKGITFVGILIALSVAEVYLNQSEIIKLVVTIVKFLLFLS